MEEFDLDDFNFESEEIQKDDSPFEYRNGVPYLKVDRQIEGNQEFFITHLEIREFTKSFGAGGRRISNLLDSEGRTNGELNRTKVENRVKHTNDNHGKEWFIIEVGIVVNVID